ncbi:MAG: DUF3293 domain-containing protein [Steroidobacteraceae bacterium]
MPTLPPDHEALRAAYTAAEYRIEAPAPLAIAIGRPSAALDALLGRHGARHGALITAANPGSQMAPASHNAAAHAALLAELAHMGLSWLATRSIDPAGHWPEEAGVFVPGIPREEAMRIAARFGQNAFVWCSATEEPVLCWIMHAMPEPQTRKSLVALLGAGHMGIGIAARLQSRGLAVVTTLEGRSAATCARVQAAQIPALPLASLRQADIILSVVPPAMAVEAAESLVAAGVLGKDGPLFADCNAISPDTIQRIDKLVRDAGGHCVDGGIVGAPPDPEGTKSPVLYVSGPQAARLRLLNEHGLDVHVLDAPVGAASSLKLCFAAVSKGLTAMVTQVAVQAGRSGIGAPLRAQLATSLGPTLAWAGRQAPMLADKSWRWVGEMEEIAHFLRDIPGAAQMFSGAAQFYDWLDREKSTADGPLEIARRFFTPP